MSTVEGIATGATTESTPVEQPPALVRLAALIATLRCLAPEDTAVAAARMHLFDTVCCLVAALGTDEAVSLHRVVGRLSTQDEMAAGDLLTLLCGIARSTELDDIHIGSCTTVGSVIVPTVLVTARGLGGHVGEDDLLIAMVAGYEAMATLGVATDGANQIYKGIWPTYLAAPFGAAAAAGYLLGLSADQMAHALSIAASRSVGMVGDTGGGMTSRWFSLGRAATEGYYAAVAASQGMQGDLRFLEGSFERAVGIAVDLECFDDRRFSRWIEHIDIKPFRTQRQSLSAVEAFISLVSGRDVTECVGVEVFSPAQFVTNIDRKDPPHHRLTPGVQYLLGLAAYDPARLWDVRRHPVRDDEALRAFMNLVQIAVDSELTVLYPDHWAGRVRVTWSDGSIGEMTVIDPKGCALQPMTWQEVRDKYRLVFRSSRVTERLGGVNTERWIDELLRTCSSSDGQPIEATAIFKMLETSGLAITPRILS